MQFIKTMLWVLFAVTLVIFAVNNWAPTSILIWPEVRVDTKLPVLVIGAFAIGFLPMWLLHRASNWRLKRRIASLEEAARPRTVPMAPVPASAPIVAEPEPAIRGEPI